MSSELIVRYKGSEFSFDDLEQIALEEDAVKIKAAYEYLVDLLELINPHFYGQQSFPTMEDPVSISRENIKINFIS